MGHVAKKVKNQLWYSILWYDSLTFRRLKSNLDLLMKIGDGNTEFCKKQMLGCVLTEDLAVHNQVLKFFPDAKHCAINENSLVLDEKAYSRISREDFRDLVNKKVSIKPPVEGEVLIIFPKGTIKEQFQARCANASC